MDQGRNPDIYILQLLESCKKGNQLTRNKIDALKQFKAQLEKDLSEDTKDSLKQWNFVNNSQPKQFNRDSRGKFCKFFLKSEFLHPIKTSAIYN